MPAPAWAATTGRLRTTVRALARLDLSPDELLSRLDDLVLQGAEEQEPGAGPSADEGLGVACLYAVYDPVSRMCTAARAGHPPAAVVDPEDGFQLLDIPLGPPLGVGGLPFESMEIALSEGSLLALFTGGLVQDRDRDTDTGVSKLKDVLSGRENSLEELCDRALSGLHPDGPATDDAALLLVRTHELGQKQVIGWELAAEPSAVSPREDARDGSADRMGPGRAVVHHGTRRERTRHQRDPARHRTGVRAAHQGSKPALRGLGQGAHLSEPAVQRHRRRGRARPVHHRADRAAVGDALHASGKTIWTEQALF